MTSNARGVERYRMDLLIQRYDETFLIGPVRALMSAQSAQSSPPDMFNDNTVNIGKDLDSSGKTFLERFAFFGIAFMLLTWYVAYEMVQVLFRCEKNVMFRVAVIFACSPHTIIAVSYTHLPLPPILLV